VATDPPRLYGDLAWLWPLWGGPGDYADYCRHVTELVRRYARVPVGTLLNLGCGGGKNLCNLKRDLAVTGVDRSPAMLALARGLNPEVQLQQGDMRTLDLGRDFDAVLLDDGVSYMTSREDLRQALETAWRHLAPGGVLVVTPDATRETFVQNRTESAIGGGLDGDPEVVFIENVYDPDPADDHYEATLVFLIRESGALRVETDRHTLGLFAMEVWRETLAEVGFETHEAPYTEQGTGYVTFACRRPG
jgi:SAM-dependent methyltransferase